MLISDTSIIILSIALVLTVSIISINKNLAGRNKVQQEVPKGMKKLSQEGQEDFVGNLKDSAAEALAFKDQMIDAQKKEIRSLTGQVSKLKGLLYGTTDPAQIAELEHEAQMPQTQSRGKKINGVPEEVVNMRLRIIGEKLKINPLLLKFDVIGDALRDIASDPNFDEIAAAALSNQNQSTISPQTPNDL